MRNVRTLVAVAALAAVALLVPSTAQAGSVDKAAGTTSVQRAYGWGG